MLTLCIVDSHRRPLPRHIVGTQSGRYDGPRRHTSKCGFTTDFARLLEAVSLPLTWSGDQLLQTAFDCSLLLQVYEQGGLEREGLHMRQLRTRISCCTWLVIFRLKPSGNLTPLPTFTGSNQATFHQALTRNFGVPAQGIDVSLPISGTSALILAI